MKLYKNYLMDMDGVLVRGRTVVDGAQRFIDTLNARGLAYLVLTNNPLYTPGDLAHRLQTMGLEVPEDRIFTSAIATARFIKSQQPGGKAFVIGDESDNPAKDRVVIEALRAIAPGEELTYDYDIQVEGPITAKDRKLWACRCGAPNCTGTMLKTAKPRTRKPAKA